MGVLKRVLDQAFLAQPISRSTRYYDRRTFVGLRWLHFTKLIRGNLNQKASKKEASTVLCY